MPISYDLREGSFGKSFRGQIVEKGRLGAGQGETPRRTRRWDWKLSTWLDNGMGGDIGWLVTLPESLSWAGNRVPSPT